MEKFLIQFLHLGTEGFKLRFVLLFLFVQCSHDARKELGRDLGPHILGSMREIVLKLLDDVEK